MQSSEAWALLFYAAHWFGGKYFSNNITKSKAFWKIWRLHRILFWKNQFSGSVSDRSHPFSLAWEELALSNSAKLHLFADVNWAQGTPRSHKKVGSEGANKRYSFPYSLIITKNNGIFQLVTLFWAYLFVNKVSRHICESERFNQIDIFKVVIHLIPTELQRADYRQSSVFHSDTCVKLFEK